MKKTVVIILVFLAVLFAVSCRHEPENKEGESAVEKNGGTITIRPAEDDFLDPPAIKWTQEKKFQFLLNQPITAEQTIKFLLKVPEGVSAITVRDGSNHPDYTKWTVESISTLPTNSDGWYIVELEEDDVTTSCEYLGITLTTDDQNPDLYCSIKNLTINGVVVEFANWDANTSVLPFLDVPSKVVATITTE